MGQDDAGWRDRWRLRRRKILEGLGVAGLLPMAGCPDGDSESGEAGDVLVTDGGPVTTTETAIDGNVVTVTLRNSGDARVTVARVELAVTDETNVVTDVDSQRVQVARTANVNQTVDFDRIAGWETTDALADIDLDEDEALTSVDAKPVNFQGALTSIDPRRGQAVVGDVTPDTDVVDDLKARSESGENEVLVDVIEIIKHTKEFANGEVQDVVVENVVEALEGETTLPAGEFEPTKTTVVGEGDAESTDVIDEIGTGSEEFPTGVEVSTSSDQFVQLPGQYPFEWQTTVDVVDDIETEPTSAVSDINAPRTAVVQNVLVDDEPGTATTKSVWDASGIVGREVTLDPGARETVEFDFGRESALLAGVAPDGLADGDIVEQWLYDERGTERSHTLLRP